MESDKLLDIYSQLLKGKKPIYVLNCMTLFFVGCLFFLFLYSTHISDAIPMFVLPNEYGAILYNITLGLLIATAVCSLWDSKVILHIILFIHKWLNGATPIDNKPITITLFIYNAIHLSTSVVSFLFIYDELAYFSENNSLRVYSGTIPTMYIISFITAYILWGIVQQSYIRLCNNHYKRFRYLSGTDYFDSQHNEILVDDIVAYQNRKYRVIKNAGEEPALFPYGKSVATPIPLNEAIKNGDILIIRETQEG